MPLLGQGTRWPERTVLARIITAAAGLPLVVGAVWLGGPWLLALVALATAVGLVEFSRLARGMGAQSSLILMVAAGVSLLLDAFWGWGEAGTIVGASVLAALAWQVSWVLLAGMGPSRNTGEPRDLAGAAAGWVYTVVGPVYLGWTLGHGMLVRDLPFGREWLLVLVVAVFATDTGAYLIGKAAGRHSLSPTLSPAKTWEGAVGGFVAGVVMAVVLASAFSLPAAWWQALLLGGSIASVAEVGDLAESLLKRAARTGASGGVLPGHGGVLDRVDSMVFALVVGYYLIERIAS